MKSGDEEVVFRRPLDEGLHQTDIFLPVIQDEPGKGGASPERHPSRLETGFPPPTEQGLSPCRVDHSSLAQNNTTERQGVLYESGHQTTGDVPIFL